jgi:hypothetical protein
VLAEFGDAEGSYASAKARKNYAGTSPITRASGKKKVVLARFVHNDRLIDALDSQAFAAMPISPGARAYYDKARARDVGHRAALRQLANRLVGILHGCLKNGTVYHEETAWPDQAKTTAALTSTLLGCLYQAAVIREVSVSRIMAVDDVAEPAFQAAQGFFVALTLGASALVVGPSCGLVADLGNRHDVPGGVQLTVPGSGQSVSLDVAGGGFEGRDAAVGAERGSEAEATDAGGASQDLGGEQVAEPRGGVGGDTDRQAVGLIGLAAVPGRPAAVLQGRDWSLVSTEITLPGRGVLGRWVNRHFQ